MINIIILANVFLFSVFKDFDKYKRGIIAYHFEQAVAEHSSPQMHLSRGEVFVDVSKSSMHIPHIPFFVVCVSIPPTSFFDSTLSV
jgi:hypothetical protein